MNKAIQHTKINEAVNLLLEGDVDLSNVLGKPNIPHQNTE